MSNQQPPNENFGLSLSEFVLAEAKEKVFEIEIRGQKILEKEKNRLVDEGEEVIVEEFAKKMRGKETERRMYSFFDPANTPLKSTNVE